MTSAEAVELTKQMRAAGASRFTLNGDRLSVVLLPPEPTKLLELSERFGELPAEERDRFLKEQKKSLDEDLYGSSGG
jgi:hypothetical protein